MNGRRFTFVIFRPFSLADVEHPHYYSAAVLPKNQSVTYDALPGRRGVNARARVRVAHTRGQRDREGT